MASGILEAVNGGVVEWTPRRAALDPHAFDCGRVGPYSLGPEVRCGPFGPVHLALGAQFDFVLELERVDGSALEATDAIGALAPRLLEHLNHCVGLRHPHVACVLGAGVDDGVPYVLRAHTLGRTLAELTLSEARPPKDVSAGILFGVAQGIQFLAEAGPMPGICGLGGLRAESVLLGWDGSIQVLGAGLALLRDHRRDADLEGLRRVSGQLDLELADLLADAGDAADAASKLRRAHRDACAHRQAAVGAWLRRADPDGCAALRRFFSLHALN